MYLPEKKWAQIRKCFEKQQSNGGINYCSFLKVWPMSKTL